MRIAPFTILAASVSVAGCLAACHKQTPPPSIDGLSAALERSADKTLAAPSLNDDQFIVPARPGQTADQTREIEALITSAGGTAVDSTTPQGDISILAQVPQNRLLLVRPLSSASMRGNRARSRSHHRLAPLHPPFSSRY